MVGKPVLERAWVDNSRVIDAAHVMIYPEFPKPLHVVPSLGRLADN
jgi:hypothetical protein